MAKRLQVIKVKDYGDPHVNRLAVVCAMFDKMEGPGEQKAALTFLCARMRNTLYKIGADYADRNRMVPSH
jgi:hypothetical protein